MIKIITQNKKARFNYQLEKGIEAGIVLTGTEIKSVREGRVNLSDGFVQIKNDEAWLMNMHISPYTFGNYNNHDPLRNRKLLLHKREIVKLKTKVLERGYTLVPTKLYFKEGKVKVEIALGKGKSKEDKRETIKQRDLERQMGRDMKKY